jgi:hypothetical protein
MTPDTAIAKVSYLRKRWPAESCAAAEPREERKTTAAPEPRSQPRKPLAVRVFQPEISSFRLHLAADGKAAKTIRNYVKAVQWFAAAHLLADTCWTGWEQVTGKISSGGWCSCRAATARRMPATSTGPCSSSSSGWPRRTSSQDYRGPLESADQGAGQQTGGSGQGFYGRKPTPGLRL